MTAMENLHRLQPCALCSVRMAVPGEPVCTMCDAVTIPAMVPDSAPPARPGHRRPSPALTDPPP